MSDPGSVDARASLHGDAPDGTVDCLAALAGRVRRGHGE